MTTSPRVSFGLYALALKQDSLPSCVDMQTFAKISDLKTDNATAKPYITFEPNYWLLDGGYKFFPANTAAIHVGLMSLSMSGADGNFSTAPELVVDFGQTHTTDSIALRFAQYSNDYCTSLKIGFYDSTDVLIREDSYYPTSWEFSTGQAVENFQKIVITFYATNKPYRYLRVTGIDYGTLITFEGEDIKSASVVEETDPISAEIPIDTLELSLFSTDSQFSVINPEGEYTALQNRQPLAVYEIVNNESVFIGNFYLQNWENKSDNEILLKAIDMIGVLDTTPYNGGLWLDGTTTVEDLIYEMFEAISTPYDLDPELYDVVINGWIPVCSYREALQQIAFAIGAYVTCSRGGLVQIYKTTLASDYTSADYTITKAQKAQSDQSLSLRTLVTGVEITAHNYLENTDSVELYNGTLAAGTHTITFNVPMHDLDITGATITESGANYAIINVLTAGTVVLNGQSYLDTTKIKGIYNTSLDTTVKPNILTVTDASLVTALNVDDVAQRVYDYYQQRYIQKLKLFVPEIEVGKSALIDTLYNKQIMGVTEKLELDLTGGFTGKAEIIGVVSE